MAGLAALNRGLISRAEAVDSPQRVVVDMDSTEIPVYGQQEHSAHNGLFESTCYHPLLLVNREGDCLAAKLRPGNEKELSDVTILWAVRALDTKEPRSYVFSAGSPPQVE